MTVYHSGPQFKYELLEGNARRGAKSSLLWAAVLLVVLIACSSILAVCIRWQQILNTSKEVGNIDFLMTGPKILPPGYLWKSSWRGRMYVLAQEEMRQDSNFTLPQLTTPTPQHGDPVEYKRVCYYNLPSSGTAHVLRPDTVSPDLCTHINIAFATVANGTIQPASPSDIQGYSEITELKKKNPQLKVMLSVNWFSSTGEFAWIVSSFENRTRFVDEAIKFLKENNLDGLDIDWEFPSWPTEVENQTDCFMELLRLLSSSFSRQPTPLILSVAVGAPKPIIDHSYNIQVMAEYVDYVNVMAYDYHMYQPYLPLTGANAPLYERQAEQGYFTTLNVNWTAAYWLFKGMPASKIIIGIPTYGHSFKLVNAENHGWEAPSSGVGSVGEDGFVTYSDVCEFMVTQGAHSVFDYESKVPYTYKNDEWISFDNEQSVAYKAELVKKHQFGGVMIFSLNTDDATASCDGLTKFPLAQRIKNVLQDDQL